MNVVKINGTLSDGIKKSNDETFVCFAVGTVEMIFDWAIDLVIKVGISNGDAVGHYPDNAQYNAFL